MFAVALVLGSLVNKSGSVWCGVLAHSVFNLGLNAIAFLFFPGLVIA
jgi:membrane protease YdiL (CAAX protease family)